MEGTSAFTQIHSSEYSNHDTLPDGRALMVRSGQAGGQIAARA